MFNGFPVTNTPAVQVWDFVRGASTAADRNVILTDDCAPIQFFKTGVASTINLYLPPSYPDGKVLTIINAPYLTTALSIAIYASDARNTTSGISGSGDNIYRVRPGQTLQFFYTKTTLDLATGASSVTGWTCISQGSANSAAPNSFATAGGTTLAANAFATGSAAIASGLQSAAVGGLTNTASGTNTFIAGGSNNIASSVGTGVFAGASNTASSSNYAVVIGGNSSTANNTNAAVLGGSASNAGGFSSVVLGGSSNLSNANSSVVVGGQSGTTRSIDSYKALPSNNPIGGSGFTQSGVLVLGRQTTDATVTTLTSNSSAAGTTNQLVLPNNAAYYVRGSCIANVTGGGNTKAWSFEAAIKRGASAAATSIVGAVIKNVAAADAGASTWDITISADTTNGALAVSVTGQAATTIRWVCRLDSTEVTY